MISSPANLSHFWNSVRVASFRRKSDALAPHHRRRCCSSPFIAFAQQAEEQSLVVVGGGAAGVYDSIRAKCLAPHLSVLIIEQGKPLAKVKISGGGRCNVTNGHFFDAAVRKKLFHVSKSQFWNNK